MRRSADILPLLLLESTVQSLGHILPRSGETPQKFELLTGCASVLRVLSESPEVRGNIPAATSFRDALVAGLNATPATETRATVLRKISEAEELGLREFNSAFVLMEFFGYLRRDANAPPDTNFDGFNFWLNKLNAFNGDFRAAEMVKSFIRSSEYRQRFGAS